MLVQKINQFKKSVATGLVAASVTVTGFAHAADTADGGIAAIQALSGTAASYIAAAVGVALVVAGGFWGISMMKKAFSAAK